MKPGPRVKTKPSVAMPSPAIPPLPVLRFSVDEYHRMIKSGIFDDREPYELIHGWIVEKMGIDPPHNYAVNALNELFGLLRGPNATVRIQQPITTTDSEPEPDVVLASGMNEDYAERNPEPAEIHLVVEVADSTLKKDQTIKLKLYAKAKIQVYWIVNLIDRCVEVYREPNGGKNPDYKQRKDYTINDSVPFVIEGKAVGHVPVKKLMR